MESALTISPSSRSARSSAEVGLPGARRTGHHDQPVRRSRPIHRQVTPPDTRRRAGRRSSSSAAELGGSSTVSAASTAERIHCRQQLAGQLPLAGDHRERDRITGAERGREVGVERIGPIVPAAGGIIAVAGRPVRDDQQADPLRARQLFGQQRGDGRGIAGDLEADGRWERRGTVGQQVGAPTTVPTEYESGRPAAAPVLARRPAGSRRRWSGKSLRRRAVEEITVPGSMTAAR